MAFELAPILIDLIQQNLTTQLPNRKDLAPTTVQKMLIDLCPKKIDGKFGYCVGKEKL